MSAHLLGAAEIRRLAAELGLRPTKRLGQNFVHDPGTVRRIVAIAGVEPGEHVLEVGPGLGSLSLGLLEAGAQLTAIEIDPRLAGRLPETVRERVPDARLRVIEQDALQLASLPEQAGPSEPAGLPVALVANLPYNVSVPVLLHLLDRLPELRRGVVMVQAEVGERLAAGPGSKAYGAPSVKAAWYGRWSLAGRVGRSVFWPVPNVDSVLLAYRARPEPVGDGTLRERVFELVDAAFGQRRKTLRRSLAGALGGAEAAAAVLAAAGIEQGARGEALELDGFLRIARAAAAA